MIQNLDAPRIFISGKSLEQNYPVTHTQAQYLNIEYKLSITR